MSDTLAYFTLIVALALCLALSSIIIGPDADAAKNGAPLWQPTGAVDSAA